MNITAYTPSAFNAAPFAISTFGFANAPDPAAAALRTYKRDVNGIVLTGTLSEILAAVPAEKWDAALVLMGNCGGENVFVRALAEKAHCPLVGGAAAIDPVSGKAGLITGGGQAAVFLMQDSRYTFEAVTQNIHTEILGEHSIEFDGRYFTAIDGQEPIAWLNAQKDAFGIPHTDFEHLTFSDMNGVNAHLSIVDGRLFSGRDLCPTMLLRRVKAEDVYPQMHAFYDDSDAIICGCAGLKGILPQDLMTDGFGLFLFGEICTAAGVSTFGNLMLSKLVIREK